MKNAKYLPPYVLKIIYKPFEQDQKLQENTGLLFPGSKY